MLQADDVPNFHEGCDCAGDGGEKLRYCNLRVVDFGGDAGISRVFKQAAGFTEAAAAAGGCVLVHCANGSNRSVTVVIALLMMLDGLDLQGAFTVVRRHRESAMPLRDNRQELLEFERKRLGQNSMKEGGFYAGRGGRGRSPKLVAAHQGRRLPNAARQPGEGCDHVEASASAHVGRDDEGGAGCSGDADAAPRADAL